MLSSIVSLEDEIISESGWVVRLNQSLIECVIVKGIDGIVWLGLVLVQVTFVSNSKGRSERGKILDDLLR